MNLIQIWVSWSLHSQKYSSKILQNPGKKIPEYKLPSFTIQSSHLVNVMVCLCGLYSRPHGIPELICSYSTSHKGQYFVDQNSCCYFIQIWGRKTICWLQDKGAGRALLRPLKWLKPQSFRGCFPRPLSGALPLDSTPKCSRASHIRWFILPPEL